MVAERLRLENALRADGDLKAEVVDSSNATFETSFAIRSAVASGS